MTNVPIHVQKIINILAMYGFTTTNMRYTGSAVMKNKTFAIYFYGAVIHKMRNTDIERTFKAGKEPVIKYTYSEKDVLKLIEDIQ